MFISKLITFITYIEYWTINLNMLIISDVSNIINNLTFHVPIFSPILLIHKFPSFHQLSIQNQISTCFL